MLPNAPPMPPQCPPKCPPYDPQMPPPMTPKCPPMPPQCPPNAPPMHRMSFGSRNLSNPRLQWCVPPPSFSDLPPALRGARPDIWRRLPKLPYACAVLCSASCPSLLPAYCGTMHRGVQAVNHTVRWMLLRTTAGHAPLACWWSWGEQAGGPGALDSGPPRAHRPAPEDTAEVLRGLVWGLEASMDPTDPESLLSLSICSAVGQLCSELPQQPTAPIPLLPSPQKEATGAGRRGGGEREEMTEWTQWGWVGGSLHGRSGAGS